MVKTLKLMVLLLVVAAVGTPSLAAAKRDDCAYYYASYNAAIAQRDIWSETLSYDQQAVSELLAARDTPLPLIEDAVQRCISDEGIRNDYQNAAYQFAAQYENANCGL